MNADMIDRFRHWLIKKLSCGDFIMMNFERQSNGIFASKNCGPILIHNFEIVDLECGTMICVGYNFPLSGGCAMAIRNNQITISNGLLRGGIIEKKG